MDNNLMVVGRDITMSEILAASTMVAFYWCDDMRSYCIEWSCGAVEILGRLDT